MKKLLNITNHRLKMRRNNTNMKHVAEKLAACCLFFFFLAGSLRAQNTGSEFVIKWNDTIFVNPSNHHGEYSGINYHFLAHVGSGTSYTLQDVTTFDPATCIWISDNTFNSGGTNKNYYFYDGQNHPRFLCAPTFSAGGALSLSESSATPPINLNHPEYKYYFYKWDNGLGRGNQYDGDCAANPTACQECGHVWGQGECWDVYWVAYLNGNWQLSSKHYNLNETYLPEGEARGGRYSQVTTTVHAADTTTVGEQSGLQALADFVLESGQSQQVTPIINNYNYTVKEAYTTYLYDGVAHHFYGNPATDHTNAPAAQSYGPVAPASYAWTLSGDGASHLSINNPALRNPTITYSTLNNDTHKTATLTLTVTYAGGAKQKTSATILVKTPCHNPVVSPTAEVSWVGATVSWTATAESYRVSWKKTAPQADDAWSSHDVGNVTSYTITGLEYETTYQYKVQATSCETADPTGDLPTFTTLAEPGLMVNGAIFGGGRMADVGTESAGGNTEIVVINCDSIGGIYGGNDIAGVVHGDNGSKITLGVNSGDANGYDADYGTTHANVNLKFGSVYGGGNGYYAYNGSSFVAASSSYNAETIEVGASVKAMTQTNQVGDVVWTNSGTNPKTLSFPSIKKTSITVTDNYVAADSIFGGAKNAFLTSNSGDGSLITINGGTILTVFGGNNIGGGQGYAYHHIVVNKTTTNLVPNIVNTATAGYGRTFGIYQLYGGGNKVAGSSTNVEINGGQLDEVFAGGNSADVYNPSVTVNCTMAAVASDGITYGNTYSNGIETYANDAITPLANYAWDGISGIYNVRTLFGGNNEATMTRVPNISLVEGSVGTVYGGGNKGDMDGLNSGTVNGNDFKYSTHVVLNSNKMLVDYIYGGCRMSNVVNSTWVELKKGHAGYVYGGCNISGDVGSTRVNPDGPTYPETLEDQEVRGATYVKAGGNQGDNIIVWKNLFAGSNGYYDCSTDGIHYTGDALFDDPLGLYHGYEIPTHNETNVFVCDGATIKGNVYAGGNLAPVGFDDNQGAYRGFPELVGFASVYMDGGIVEQNVYGGGNMADIYGENSVRVAGGTIVKALYGGNDRAGQVAEKTKRILPYDYTIASDAATSLTALGVKTYVGISGDAHIGTVYGGGNGDYTYGGPNGIQYCGVTPKLPIQPHTFVDVHINGGADGGKIGTVYGGGNGVTVRHGVTVFLNVQSPNYANDGLHVDTIFGGNNKGDLDIVPDIFLVHGKVGTVYGGCNQGAMVASEQDVDGLGNTVDHLETIAGYPEIGSYVRLLNNYVPNETGTPVTVTAKVTQAVYGGCRMNGVAKNSLVLVEGGDFTNTLLFGGSDISGTVSGNSRVAVLGGTVGKVFGGGNGNYTYNNNGNVYTIPTTGEPVLVATGISNAPICAQSGADILGGKVGYKENNSNVVHEGFAFGGGYGEGTSTTGNVTVNVGIAAPVSADAIPVIYGNIYGGSALGTVNTNASNSTTVNFLNGELHGKVFGGGLGMANGTGEGETIIDNSAKGQVKGKVFVNISSSTQAADKCFIDLREGNVYGCNNTNGSPQDDVEVHVWKTAFNFSDYSTGDNYTSQDGTNGQGAVYAIDQVFGGGNQANYAPENGNENSTKKALVYIHDCLNTIRRVFSGGNAAAATGVRTIIEGGRFDYVFGGGNGEVSPANIGKGGTHMTLSAGLVNHLFGGSNLQGEILGPVYTEVNGSNFVPAGEGVTNPCNEEVAEFFGGSNEAVLEADVYTLIECGSGLIGDMYGGSNKANIDGNVRLDVRGGSFTNVYGGSKGVRAQEDNPETEDVDETVAAVAANIDGNVTLNLEGGTIENAFGGSNNNGNITGEIKVNVIDYELPTCELDLTNVYGGGNLASYSPTNGDGPVVNVMHIKVRPETQLVQGVKGNVFGGGNEAQVNTNTRVNIGYDATTMSQYLPDDLSTASNQPNTSNFHAYVTGNVYGGGNQAGVTGSTHVNVYSGEVCQSFINGQQSVGIYGGCNTSGTVEGNANVKIYGGTIGRKGIYNNGTGTVSSSTKANIHGGGFGVDTEVNGDVNVTFGDLGAESSLVSPRLYGDLYGGSALGNVNASNSYNTTVNVYNGQISGVLKGYNVITGVESYEEGNVFGGGLGDADHAAMVRGTVHVNVGKANTYPSCDLEGKATLRYCNVFGCNNVNGSPQYHVYVDIYKTAQVQGETTVPGDDYAILTTFGGGNRADYAPNGWVAHSPFVKTHVYVHGCDNTIQYVYGGGNAADAIAVQTLIEGGRFDEIYGGGNGLVAQANIGAGGSGFNVNGGHVNYVFEGCNKNGSIIGHSDDPTPAFPEGCIGNCGQLVIDSYYFGANEAEHFGDLENVITCTQASEFEYKYVYAGSRWAILYGDIKLTVKGGNIQYLYGGSKGYLRDNIPADVRRFPSYDELDDDLALPLAERKYSDSLQRYMRDTLDHPERKALVGHGGNIVLVVQGGTIGDVVGGCDELGNVEGKITVIVDDDCDCGLHIGNVYGANNETYYAPINDDTHHAYYEPGSSNAVPTPKVHILKGDVGYTPTTFTTSGETHPMEGNVYGGGKLGNITSNPIVVVGESSQQNHVGIKGDVMGGGKLGAVDGNSQVLIVPQPHTLTITQPAEAHGEIIVTDRSGNTISSGTQVDEYADLHLKAISSVYGYKLNKWVLTNGSVLFEKSVNTMFTMGTDDATIDAEFVAVDTHSFTCNVEGTGSVAITDGFGEPLSNAPIGEGAVLNLAATTSGNNVFVKWTETQGNGNVANLNDAVTTFTMGTTDCAVKATFKPTHTLTINQPASGGTIKVYDVHGNLLSSGVPIGETAVLTLVATPAENYRFSAWDVVNGTVAQSESIYTTFTMGTDDASITATFVEIQSE